MYQPNVTCVGEMKHLSDIKEINTCATTDRVLFCISGIFKKMKGLKRFQDRIYHFFTPNTLVKYHGDENQQNLLLSFVYSLTKIRKPKGLIIGGYSQNLKYIDKKGMPVSTSEMSLDMLHFLKKPFKEKTKKTRKCKVDLSFFLFQKNKNIGVPSRPVSAFLYDKVNDVYYVNCILEKRDRSFVNVMKKSDIRRHFRFMHVSDNDRVFIGLNNKKPIKNSYWNTSNVKFSRITGDKNELKRA